MAQGAGRNGELFDRICDPGYLIRCARAAARGKRSKPDVARFLLDLEPRCFDLADQLRADAWRPGPYRSFWISDPKRRLISAAPFADRVIHHALVTAMEPSFERRFVDHSYACRRGRGTHRALRRAFRLARRHRFVLKGDVVRFFPSLDHGVVMESVSRVVADRRFLEVLQRVVDGSNPQEPVVHHFPGDDLFTPLERRHGIPIGNLTSQFLANVVLDRLDHHVMDDLGHGAYVRYCDDFLVFSDDAAELRRVRCAVERRLAALRLRAHPGKTRVIGTRSPIPFLGFVLHGGRLRLQRRAVVRASRRFGRLADAVRRGEAPPSALAASVQAWLAHAAHGDTRGIVARVLRFASVTTG